MLKDRVGLLLNIDGGVMIESLLLMYCLVEMGASGVSKLFVEIEIWRNSVLDRHPRGFESPRLHHKIPVLNEDVITLEIGCFLLFKLILINLFYYFGIY